MTYVRLVLRDKTNLIEFGLAWVKESHLIPEGSTIEFEMTKQGMTAKLNGKTEGYEEFCKLWAQRFEETLADILRDLARELNPRARIG